MDNGDLITPTRAGLALAAGRLKILGHPARLQILFFIEEAERSVTAIQEHIKLTQAMASQHLRILYQAKIIQRRKVSTSMYYQITESPGRGLLRCLRKCQPLWYDVSP